MATKETGPAPDDIESILQIDALGVDVETIVARIREGLVEHALDDAIEFPTFAIVRARRGDDARLPEELYYQLEQANLNYDQIWVELSLVQEQMPLVGRFVNRFKGELHRLVVYYVNMLGERQVTMNDALVRTLNQLVEAFESPDTSSAEIEALKSEIADLNARVEQLESQAKLGK